MEHGLQACGLSSCDSQALEHRLNSCDTRTQLLFGMWRHPRSGMESVSPALAGGFFTTEPLVKLSEKCLDKIWGRRAAGCEPFFCLVGDEVIGSHLNYQPSDSNQSGGLSTCAQPEVTASHLGRGEGLAPVEKLQ